jgi:hypothetical protein
MNMYSLTLFKSIFDNKTHKRLELGSWEDFERLLYKLSAIPYASKKDAHLFSPARFKSLDSTRKNVNVDCWDGWAAVDVDDHVFEGDLKEELKNKYGDMYYVCYSTASCREGKPKFRLVFPLTTVVPADKIKHFWFALNSHLGSIGDQQTKDLSRMYYVPGSYEGADNFIFSNKGEMIDPYKLMEMYPFTEPEPKTFLDKLPPEVREQVLQHRKALMDNKYKYTWSGLLDCPFVKKSALNSYLSTTHVADTGRYHAMYKFMISVAYTALGNRYPITSQELSSLCRELDSISGDRYKNRPFEIEAESAINYAYKHVEVS